MRTKNLVALFVAFVAVVTAALVLPPAALGQAKPENDIYDVKVSYDQNRDKIIVTWLVKGDTDPTVNLPIDDPFIINVWVGIPGVQDNHLYGAHTEKYGGESFPEIDGYDQGDAFGGDIEVPKNHRQIELTPENHRLAYYTALVKVKGSARWRFSPTTEVTRSSYLPPSSPTAVPTLPVTPTPTPVVVLPKPVNVSITITNEQVIFSAFSDSTVTFALDQWDGYNWQELGRAQAYLIDGYWSLSITRSVLPAPANYRLRAWSWQSAIEYREFFLPAIHQPQPTNTPIPHPTALRVSVEYGQLVFSAQSSYPVRFYLDAADGTWHNIGRADAVREGNRWVVRLPISTLPTHLDYRLRAIAIGPTHEDRSPEVYVTFSGQILITEPTPRPVTPTPTVTPTPLPPTPTPSPTPLGVAVNGKWWTDFDVWPDYDGRQDVKFMRVAPENRAPGVQILWDAWEKRADGSISGAVTATTLKAGSNSELLPTGEWMIVEHHFFFHPEAKPYLVTGTVTGPDQDYYIVPELVFNDTGILYYVSPTNVEPIVNSLLGGQAYHITWNMRDILPLIQQQMGGRYDPKKLAGVNSIKHYSRAQRPHEAPFQQWDYFGILDDSEFSQKPWRGSNHQYIWPVYDTFTSTSAKTKQQQRLVHPPEEMFTNQDGSPAVFINAGGFESW